MFADTISGGSSSNNNHYILSCNQNADCNLSVKNDNTSNSAIFHQDGLALINKTNSIWHGNNILELRSGFGTGLAYSYFVNFQPIQLSDQFFNASYINNLKKIAIIQDQRTPNQYLIVCLFNDNVKSKIILSNSVLDFGSFTPIGENQVKFAYYDSQGNYLFKIIDLNLNCTSSS